MNSKELNKIVSEYYKFHKQRKELDHEIDKLRTILLENFPEGSSRTSDNRFQVNKSIVPSVIIEQYIRSEHFKIEVSKLK